MWAWAGSLLAGSLTTNMSSYILACPWHGWPVRQTKLFLAHGGITVCSASDPQQANSIISVCGDQLWDVARTTLCFCLRYHYRVVAATTPLHMSLVVACVHHISYVILFSLLQSIVPKWWRDIWCMIFGARLVWESRCYDPYNTLCTIRDTMVNLLCGLCLVLLAIMQFCSYAVNFG